ncbi:hypothetical protein HY492_01265 [Candidatus Woesearchaeota archaeon]|nr:hypothetical protein [Candidatus Woesearchaeota archaeon]
MVKRLLSVLLVALFLVPFVVAEDPIVENTPCDQAEGDTIKYACALPAIKPVLNGKQMTAYECVRDGPNSAKGHWKKRETRIPPKTYEEALKPAFGLGDSDINKLYGAKVPAGTDFCADPAMNPCIASRADDTASSGSDAHGAILQQGACRPFGGPDGGASCCDPTKTDPDDPCSCKPKETPSGGGPSGEGSTGGAAQNVDPNLGLGIAIIIATLVSIGFVLEGNTRNRLLFSLGILAVSLILTIGFVARPGAETKYAVIEPLLQMQTAAVFDTSQDMFIAPQKGDAVVTQLNSEQGIPLTVTRHYVFSGSDQKATADDLGLLTISAAGPTPYSSQILFTGPSADDPLQNLLVTAAITDNGADILATANINVEPTEVFQTIVNGELNTILTTADRTYIDTQPASSPVASFTPDQTITSLNDLTQATPDVIVGITSDGTLGTLDVTTQEFTSTDVVASDIVRPPTETTNIVEANPDYIPVNSILLINPDNTAQLYDINTRETETLGQVAGTSATLTKDGTLVSVDETGQYAYRATLDTASATLTDYQRLSLNTISTVTLSDPTLQTTISAEQLLATSSGEISFDAYAVDAATFAVRTVLEADSYYQIRVYATTEPITAEQAEQLTPSQVWYANNPYAYQNVFEDQGTADLTQFYISVQMERIGAAQTAEWTDITEPQFADATRTDTFAIAPTQETTITVNTATEYQTLCNDPTVTCVNTQNEPVTLCTDASQLCIARTDTTLTTADATQTVIANNINDYYACLSNTANTCRTSYDSATYDSAFTATNPYLTTQDAQRQVMQVNTVYEASQCLQDSRYLCIDLNGNFISP